VEARLASYNPTLTNQKLSTGFIPVGARLASYADPKICLRIFK
jgi:hypothetical protein